MAKTSLSLNTLMLLFLAFSYCHATAQTVFTHRARETEADTRPDYEVALLRLALEKTLHEYGPYVLQVAPRINITRGVQSIKSNTFPNYFLTLGYDEAYTQDKNMTYVRFPVDLGVLSYRTCFIPEEIKNKVEQITTKKELAKLTVGQGRGWVDGIILKHNGFQVIEVEQYDTLFKMTAAHRFDLFCRGVNEIKTEYDHWHTLKGLAYDRSMLIYYPMPIFYYTHSSNKTAIERITKGLKKAYADGSLLVVWKEQFQASIEFAKLNQRRIFRFDNPLAKSINFDYAHYFYNVKNP